MHPKFPLMPNNEREGGGGGGSQHLAKVQCAGQSEFPREMTTDVLRI